MKIKLYTATLLVLLYFSCSKEPLDINNLNETIFVRHKNADMPAYIHGNGSEKVFLIMLHGGPGGNGLSLRVNSIRTEIEKECAVVYFDQRGSGYSQGNYSAKDISVDIMAEDVLALAKVIKNKYGQDSKLFLMGSSWGGTLGPAALLKNQEDFLGWIDVAGSHDSKGMYDMYKVVLKEMADRQIALGNSVEHWLSILDLVQGVGQNYSVDEFFDLNRAAHKSEAKLIDDKVVNEIKADYGNNLILNNPITLLWNSIGISTILAYKKGLWGEVSYTDRLSEIKIPSLVLWGKYDLVVPTIYGQEAFDNLGSIDKELFIFENSGHGPMFTEPDLFAHKVIIFINRFK